MAVPERPEWDDRADEPTYDLILPFVVVNSEGGEYDDDSFVAGFQMGRIDGLLAPRTIAATTDLIYVSLIKQADLIAMKHNYKFDVLYKDEHWAQIGFTREDT